MELNNLTVESTQSLNEQDRTTIRADGTLSSQEVTEYMYRPGIDLESDKTLSKERRGCRLEITVFYMTIVFFWFLSLLTVALGVYVYHERTVPVLVALEVHIEPSSILIVCGLIAFLMTISGFIGGLRENICLLKLFAFGLLILVATQIAFLVLIFLVLYTNVNIIVNPHNCLQSALMLYFENDGMRDLLDFLQINFHCCGVDGYLDWRSNPYFNCTAMNPSDQRCGVPFSCCRIIEGESMNTLCGIDATNETTSFFNVQHKIYTDGCVHAIVRLLQENAFLIGSSIFGTTILMFIGVFAAARMATQVHNKQEYRVLSLQLTDTTLL